MRSLRARPPEYLKLVETLAADTVSTPIVTADGVFIARVTARREAAVPPLAEIRDKVEKDYKAKEAAKMMQETYDKLKKDIKKYNDMSAFAQAMALKDDLSTRVAVNESFVPGLGNLNQVREYLSTLKLGEMSDVIRLPEGNDPTLIAVVQVR